MYEVFDHTADLGLRVKADSFEELLADAAAAMFSVIANRDQVEPRLQRAFDISGGEHDYLLFDWLNELLYVFDTERLLFSRFEVQRTEHGLRGVAHGEPIDPARHQLEHEVKAITYHGLKVEQQGAQWLAEVIVDI